MTVREVMKCCTSPVWITLDEDSRNGELEILVENTENAEDVLSEWILDHKVHLMHCSGNWLNVSLFIANDAKAESEVKE